MLNIIKATFIACTYSTFLLCMTAKHDANTQLFYSDYKKTALDPSNLPPYTKCIIVTTLLNDLENENGIHWTAFGRELAQADINEWLREHTRLKQKSKSDNL